MERKQKTENKTNKTDRGLRMSSKTETRKVKRAQKIIKKNMKNKKRKYTKSIQMRLTGNVNKLFEKHLAKTSCSKVKKCCNSSSFFHGVAYFSHNVADSTMSVFVCVCVRVSLAHTLCISVSVYLCVYVCALCFCLPVHCAVYLKLQHKQL